IEQAHDLCLQFSNGRGFCNIKRRLHGKGSIAANITAAKQHHSSFNCINGMTIPSSLAQILGRTMVLVAHPDDESIACGGLLQKMRSPFVVFATDGAPEDDFFWGRYGSRAAYSKLRQEEALSALDHV